MIKFYYHPSPNPTAAERANALKDRHAFKAELDDEARQHLFRHNTPRAA